MSLLIPLGLLGLLGLIVLILIYILKPNYQQKVISSTYVWKLSLRYKKKRLPISKLRNLLILICQILIICAAALILSKPAIVTNNAVGYDEKIIVIDASADMLAAHDEETRFARAVEMARSEAEAILDKDGRVTVITAGRQASYAVQRAGSADRSNVMTALTELQCSYGVADVEGAMTLAEETLLFNPDAEVVYYTGTHYRNEGTAVRVEYVDDETDWNAAILGAKATIEDNYYVFEIQVACYGVSKRFEVQCELSGVNDSMDSVTLPSAMVEAQGDETITVTYSAEAERGGYNLVFVSLEDMKIYSFEEMYIHIDEADSYFYDNEYYIYGAKRPTVKVEYYSPTPNTFYSSVLSVIANAYRPYWDIEIKEVRGKEEPIIEGFDFYIFENEMPEKLPTDGVVFMANPDKSLNAGFDIGRTITIQNYEGDGVSLAPGAEHPIMENTDASNIKVTRYTQVEESSLDGFDVLMYYEGNPVFFVKNEPDIKLAVLTFGTKYSTIGVDRSFPIIMSNLFAYYFPTTFPGEIYHIYDKVDFTARGTGLEVTYNAETVLLEEGSAGSLILDRLGTYTVTQDLLSGEKQIEKLYVRIASSESNIKLIEDVLPNPYVEKEDDIDINDLVLYFAAVLVGLLMLERLLQSFEGI